MKKRSLLTCAGTLALGGCLWAGTPARSADPPAAPPPTVVPTAGPPSAEAPAGGLPEGGSPPGPSAAAPGGSGTIPGAMAGGAMPPTEGPPAGTPPNGTGTEQAPYLMHQMSADEHEMTHPGIAIHAGGFGDIDVAGAGATPLSGFMLGQGTAHLSAELSPSTLLFSELTLTARTDAGTGSPPATGFNAEIERLIIRFEQSDALKISFGRYHTPINYWNTAFHHGLWLQTTISRPEMVKFGGQFIPVHFVGGLLEGSIPAGGLNLNYDAGVGNGRGPISSRAEDAGQPIPKIAWLLNAFIKPEKLYGLQVGGSVYQDSYNTTVGTVRKTYDEWITAAHLVWLKETPEFISEYAKIRHREIGGPTLNSEAYYIQVAYRLPWFDHRLKPYYRFEKIGITAPDPLFTSTPSLAGSITGARYDLSDFVALKMEYRNLRRSEPVSIRGVYGQISFTL